MPSIAGPAVGTARNALTPYKAQQADIKHADKYERIRFLTQQEERYEQYWQPELERAARNARMYWHINFGQWPEYVVEKLRSQGRRPPTYPIIPDKIETLIGSFLANNFDIKIEPQDGKLSTLCLRIQDMMYSDRANMDWESPEIECLLNWFIQIGYERMLISDEVDDFGNIAFESLDSQHVLVSPNWKSNMVRDLKNYFIWDYKTGEEIINTPAYSHVSDKLKLQAEKELAEGIDYGTFNGGAPRWRSVEEKWMSQHRVIEFHHVESSDRKYEYDLANHTFFPETGFKMGTDEDRQVKMGYIERMGLRVDDITWLPQKKKTKYLEAFVPTIDQELFLTEGKDIIQTNNVNLYPLSLRFKGQNQGLVDKLYDIQQGINKAEMTDQDIMQRSAKGAFVLDRALSGGDPELEQQIEQGWNAADARIWVDEGSTENLKNGGIIELPGSHLAADRTNWVQQQYDRADQFSKVPAAQDSRAESGQESGRLFRYKLEVGQIGQKYMMKFWERHKKAKTEAYILQAKITYAGYPRTFGERNGKDVFKINRIMENTVNGTRFIEDDISQLPRMKVILTPDKQGINIRQNIKSELYDSLQLLTNPEEGLLKAITMNAILKTSNLPEEINEPMEKAMTMLTMELSLGQAVRIMQAQQMLAQIGATGQQMAMGGIAPPGLTAPEDGMEQQVSESSVPPDKATEGTNQDQIFPEAAPTGG